jgi:hypothetical protein
VKSGGLDRDTTDVDTTERNSEFSRAKGGREAGEGLEERGRVGEERGDRRRVVLVERVDQGRRDDLPERHEKGRSREGELMGVKEAEEAAEVSKCEKEELRKRQQSQLRRGKREYKRDVRSTTDQIRAPSVERVRETAPNPISRASRALD